MRYCVPSILVLVFSLILFSSVSVQAITPDSQGFSSYNRLNEKIPSDQAIKSGQSNFGKEVFPQEENQQYMLAQQEDQSDEEEENVTPPSEDLPKSVQPSDDIKKDQSDEGKVEETDEGEDKSSEMKDHPTIGPAREKPCKLVERDVCKVTPESNLFCGFNRLSLPIPGVFFCGNEACPDFCVFQKRCCK